MGTRDLMGNTFQKAIVLSMLIKNQQFIKILCKLQRILLAEEQHGVLLHVTRHVTMCFQSHQFQHCNSSRELTIPRVPTLTPGLHLSLLSEEF